jgi:tetratricopeptide (TPR) repeat protein
VVPSQIHVIHQVSTYGYKKKVEPQNRCLKVLFMACSPEGISPVLDFEKEEEIILEVTRGLLIDIDVEDTGSLEGLQTCLVQYYDVVHITGHADIGENGPFFLMEDEFGYPVRVTPSQLWEALKVNPPRLLFLSGCLTGGANHEAAASFAHELVLKHSPTVLGWGLPVSDPGATIAAAKVYFELSRGNSLLEGVFSARQELYDRGWPDWSLLRLFSDGTPLYPLVEKGQEITVKARDIQYAYLLNSQVRVLKKGFIGRRRQIQRSMKTLKKDESKVGVLLHGTGGLGKSCLAGKLCEQLKNALIIVHGELSEVSFFEAVKDAFIRTGDEEGLNILQEKKEMRDKIQILCYRPFLNGKYLIVLDDFEKNLKGCKEGTPVVSGEAESILEALLQWLLSVKMIHIIMTSRYTFPLIVKNRNLIKERLESIGLTSFRGADKYKKIDELTHIKKYPKSDTREKLIEAGHGNPRLMEALNTLIAEEGIIDEALLDRVKGKQEEFIQDLILKEILKSQPHDFQKVMHYSSVYRLPALREGIGKVCKNIGNWQSFVDKGVQLSLMEESGDRVAYYWVTPLLREEMFKALNKDEQKMCHEAAINYYQEVLLKGYAPLYAFELIEHALKCGIDEIAIKEGGRLLTFLRENLLYKDALYEGEHILSEISGARRDGEFSLFLNVVGLILDYVGDPRKAIDYFEKALSIDRELFGENHPGVATDLSNLGLAWAALGDPRKAIDYMQKAYDIFQEILGDQHPNTKATKEVLDMLKDIIE